MRLRTGLRVLWRKQDEVQIGTDPRWAIRLTGLSAGEIDLLTALENGIASRGLTAVARSLDVPRERLDPLLAALEQAQLLCPDGPSGYRTTTPPHLPPGSTPDAATWTRLLQDGDGDGLVAARTDRTVGLLGAGRIGLSLVVTLAAAGVGTVLVEDELLVSPSDLGVGGYTARDLGTARRAAAARVLRDVAPDARTLAPAGTRPDVMVLVEHGAADALRARVLMSAGVVHLSVVVREADVVVGPLVRPGSSPCLRCLDLHRTDADERWPAIATQLASSTPTRGAGEESLLAAIAGSLAAGQVLAQLDGTPPRTLGASFEVALPDAVPRVRDWPAHPRCGCTGLPASLRR